MANRAIALSADYGYINQITTTAKSIFYHNADITLYVINTDIPQEWFSNINIRLQGTSSQVVNIPIDKNIINNEHVSQPQINALSYGRILIPRLINEDQVLYLDSDIVVDGNLNDLLNLNLDNVPLAAIPDVIYDGDFNSGVMLFNNKLLRTSPDLVDQMLEYGQNDNLAEGDQSVLNHFFRDSYLHLGYEYNYVIGYDFFNFYYSNDRDLFQNLTGVSPKIIHFTGPQKPWEMVYSGRMRDKWWQYANLEWSEVINHQPLPKLIDYREDGQCLTFTSDENLLQIEQIVQALPNVTFNIAAWTPMGWNIMKLIKYPNVHLYPNVVGPSLELLEQKANCYLDINYGGKEMSVIDTFTKSNKPILAFTDTSAGQQNEQVFDNVDINGMIEQIKSIINK